MLYLTDRRKSYHTSPIASAPHQLRLAETDIDRLHKEIELYKKTWLAACNDIAELEKASCERQAWSAAWATVARTWRKIARYNQEKVTLLETHIDTQEAVIRDLHEQIGYLKAEVEKRNEPS